jgi:hypothetical protein
MKQLRPVINRIIKKIPDKDMEQVLGYLGSMFPKEAFPEIVPALTATMKSEQDYATRLIEKTREMEM